MKIKVYQSENDKYVEMEIIAKYKYIGHNGGISLTTGKIYNCVGNDEDLDMIRIVDDTDEDYLYNKDNFELVED
jgi:hypothetical protein